jgi:tetratricopeptide (TPR) repeat protein
VATYEILVRHSMDPARKIELLHQIGDLYELANEDARRSAPTTARCAKSRGSKRRRRASSAWRARSIAGRIWSRSTTRWSSRSASLGRRRAADAAALLTRIAQIEETQLGDNDASAAAYHRVLKVAPQQLEAANALQAIYLRTDAYTKLVDVVLAKVDMVGDIADKKELLFKAAQIYEEVLENADRAIDVYRQVLQLDENDRAAIDASSACTSGSSVGSR